MCISDIINMINRLYVLDLPTIRDEPIHKAFFASWEGKNFMLGFDKNNEADIMET